MNLTAASAGKGQILERTQRCVKRQLTVCVYNIGLKFTSLVSLLVVHFLHSYSPFAREMKTTGAREGVRQQMEVRMRNSLAQLPRKTSGRRE